MQNHRNIIMPFEAKCFESPYRKFLSVHSAPEECLEHATDANHTTYIGGNMGDRILAATPLSHNDISGLAQLFEQAFRYYRRCKRQLKANQQQTFLQHIRTIVGLSFTVTLVCGDLIDIFDSYLNIFLQNQTFLNPQTKPKKLADAFANMISLGSDFFRCLEHPGYYEYFLETLRDCLKHIINDMGIVPSLKMKNVVSLIFSR